MESRHPLPFPVEPSGGVRPRMEPPIFDESLPGHRGYDLPAVGVPTSPLADLLPGVSLRETPPALPELAEPHVVRHYTRLSQLNHAVDLGSTLWGRAP